MAIRTDLAMETVELTGGPKQREESCHGCKRVETVISPDDKITGKPPGRYLTLCLPPEQEREPETFGELCQAVAGSLEDLSKGMPSDAPVLVAGLGNRAITPDALGPLTCEFTLATRHLIAQEPNMPGLTRPVSVLAPGVLGTTGLETAEIIRGVLDNAKPALLVAVDALAARRLSRLLCTVQLTDTGIIPGSGVAGGRTALNRDTLGIPVVGIGVPTVADGATIAADLRQQGMEEQEALRDLEMPMLVTLRDIDRQVRTAARIIGYGINLFLHPRLTVADLDALLS